MITQSSPQKTNHPLHIPPQYSEPVPLDWMDPMVVGRVRSALEARGFFQDRAGEIQCIQTHISTVFLTSAHVFKFKRPLDVGFADFRSLARRRRFCGAEIRLNRRLAEGVYLGMLPLLRSGEGFALGPAPREGEVVDWCVVMRRLPADHMLDHRLKAGGTLDAEELEALADLLVRFHATPTSRVDLHHFGSLEVIGENWEENFRQTESQIGVTLSAWEFKFIRQTVAEFMTRHANLFAARAGGGFIRDGHGDLRCEHICLGSAGEAGAGTADGKHGIRIIDCIEFNDRFRYGDVANDLAFLLMDLTALRHPGLARTLLGRYAERSGDPGLGRLIPFYCAYRAYVRGKVTGFKLQDKNLSPAQYTALRARAEAHFALAWEFCRQMAPPLLVLICGMMGVGKSSLAGLLAERVGIPVYHSDAIRKTLAGDQTLGRNDPFGEGLYTAEWSRKTYQKLLAKGGEELRKGNSVILDASFSAASWRREAMELAGGVGARVVMVECQLEERINLARLEKRSREGNSLSDGRKELLALQKSGFERVTEFPPGEHFVIDTAKPAPENVAQLLQLLNFPPDLFSLSG